MDRTEWAVDREGEAVRVTADWSSTSASVAVVEALAVLEGDDPVSLSLDDDLGLRDRVAPEALNRLLFDDRRGPSLIEFDLGEYTVRAAGEELVVGTAAEC